MTRSAERFVGPATFAALSDHRVYTDLWEEPGTVLHVRSRARRTWRSWPRRPRT